MSDPVQPDPAAPDLGRRLGRYRLLELVGRGAVGEVYRAQLEGPLGFSRSVAVKVLRKLDPDLLAGADELLVHEAQLGASLRHPNLVHTHELDEEDGRLFLVMEWVGGPSLAHARKRLGPPPAEAVVAIGVQVCAGLAAAHGHIQDGKPAPIVHCDLKLGNILLAPDGTVKIADFGVARLGGRKAGALDGFVAGTPGYMPPEQLAGARLTPAADLYALGVVLYDLIVGHKPWPGTSKDTRRRLAARIERRLGTDEVGGPVEARLPGLWPVLRATLEPDPARRIGDATALATALAELVPEATAQAALLAWRLGEEVSEIGSPPEPPILLEQATEEPTDLVSTPPRDQVPWQNSRFFGRKRTLASLRDRIARPGVLALVGPAGGGKTRLAQELGHAFAREGGQAALADLESCRNRDAVVGAVAAALGVPVTGVDDAQRVGHALARRDDMLLILDGCDRVADPVRTLVGDWFDAAPDLRLLLTSRQQEGLPPADIVPIDPLPKVAARELFVDRARLVRSDFALADGEEALLDRLLEQLDRLPLAIELAAGRVAVMGLDALSRRLGERFQLLRKPGGTGKQAALFTAIDWSWQLLSPGERLCLAQCSVFRGGFTARAAEAVVDLTSLAEPPYPLDAVQSLVDRNLIRRQDGIEERFGLYESVRVFAAERLLDPRSVPGDESTGPTAAAAARARHRQWYGRLFDGSRIARLHSWERPTIQALWTAEIDNLLQGLRSGVDDDDPDGASSCFLAAGELLQACGAPARLLPLSERLFDADGTARGDQAADVHRMCAWLWGWAGDLEVAERHARLAVQLAHQDGGAALRARCLHALATVVTRGDGPGPALELHRGAVELARVSGDSLALRNCLGGLGVVFTALSRHDEATVALREALDTCKRVGDHGGMARQLGNLAVVHANRGRMEAAWRCFEETVHTSREAGEWLSLALNLGNLGVTRLHRGDAQGARAAYKEALDVARRIGSRRAAGFAAVNWGELELDHGELADAHRLLTQGVDACETTWRVAAESGRSLLAVVLARQGESMRSRIMMDRALVYLRRGGHKEELVRALCRQVEVELRADDRRSAKKALTEAKEQLATLDQPEDSMLHGPVQRAAALLARR